MNAIDTTNDPARSAASDNKSDEPAVDETSDEASPEDGEFVSVDDGELASVELAELDAAVDEVLASVPAVGADGTDAAGLKPDRKKLEEQLEALKRKEFELRRALLMADHPELADSIRVLEGRIFAITRAEGKLAQGLSKADARKRDTLDKKLGSLREKRAELDAQIEKLEADLTALGADRSQVYEAERREAIEQLLVSLSEHEPAFRAAGIEAVSLVPELTRWLPEVERLAETLVKNRPST